MCTVVIPVPRVAAGTYLHSPKFGADVSVDRMIEALYNARHTALANVPHCIRRKSWGSSSAVSVRNPKKRRQGAGSQN